MSESKRTSGPQFRADDPQEQETVRTTIVGGRPPGSGQRLGPIPRGVEVLVKKAAVDAEFKRVLLAERAGAAQRIGLELDPAESMMLQAVPAGQLETIITRTMVPREHRRAFLGTAAAAMLATLGLVSPACNKAKTAGEDTDMPPFDEQGRPTRNKMAETGGAEPDMPDKPIAPDSPDGSAEDAGSEPNSSPAPGPAPTGDGEATAGPQPPDGTGFDVRPAELPAPTGSRPDLPEPPPGAAPPGARP